MSRLPALLLGLAACGDNLAAPVPDAGPLADARFTGCAATFHGNFEEAVHTTGACATVARDDAGVTLALELPVVTLTSTLSVSIGLGDAPGPGDYTSDTLARWSASAIQRMPDDGVCVYIAGDAVAPHGHLAITLDTIDVAAGVAHGALVIDQRVLQWPGTDCGDGDVETVTIHF